MTRSTTRRAAATISALALAAGALSTAGSASAAVPKPDNLMRGLVSPLSLALGAGGRVYVTQNFAGTLTMKRPGHKASTIYQAARRTEVGAISERRGNLAFATTEPDGDTFLYRVGNSGEAVKVANLSRHERKKNPDRKIVYGARELTDSCEDQWPTGEDAPPARYNGIVESHPYATYQTKRKTYVADAAANAILSVNRRGRVRTVALIPPTDIIITPSLAQRFDLPDCALGLQYWFEGVPTDVEKGRKGRLYVTSLPGGPEDPSLGERGSIFRVNPKTGKARRSVEELMSPTGLAIAPSGAMYVAELFANRISRVRAGKHIARTWTKVNMPADVERSRRGVHATVRVLLEPPSGKVVRWKR
jgi:hypothetical protein